MSQMLIQQDTLVGIGDAIRGKTGKTASIPVKNLASEIEGISGGGSSIPDGYIKPSGTVTVTENGTVDVTNYASAQVNVPVPDGYVKPSGTKSITANGTHSVSGYANAEVNVPVGVFPSGTKSITANGTVDVTNYASVSVNVPTETVEEYDGTVTVSGGSFAENGDSN